MLKNTVEVQELAFAMNALMDAETMNEESAETERYIRAVRKVYGVQGTGDITDFMLYLLTKDIGENQRILAGDVIHDILQEADLRVQVLDGL